MQVKIIAIIAGVINRFIFESSELILGFFDDCYYTSFGVLINQMKIADIYKGIQRKAQHKYRIFYVNGVTKQDEAAD